MNQSEILITCSNRKCRHNFPLADVTVKPAGWGWVAFQCPRCNLLIFRPRKEIKMGQKDES